VGTWSDLRCAEPELAEAGRALLYQHGVGLAYLATVCVDGSPRVHPICPLFFDDRLFAFIIPSPKQRDLNRDGRYALHSFPRANDEDAFFVTGTASRVTDPVLRAVLSEQFVAERAQFGVPRPADDHLLFEFGVDRCLLTRTSGHGDVNARKTLWRAGNDPAADPG
jgi:hypothetical protein